MLNLETISKFFGTISPNLAERMYIVSVYPNHINAVCSDLLSLRKVLRSIIGYGGLSFLSSADAKGTVPVVVDDMLIRIRPAPEREVTTFDQRKVTIGTYHVFYDGDPKILPNNEDDGSGCWCTVLHVPANVHLDSLHLG